MLKRLIFFALLVPLTAQAQQNQFKRFLLPIYLAEPVSGAHGSIWASELAIFNPTSADFHNDWCAPLPAEGCPIPLLGNAYIQPGETETSLPSLGEPVYGGHGRVLYIRPFSNPAGDPNALAFQLRVFDRSRIQQTAGTEIPVIREADFRHTTAYLLNIPVDANSRLTFRLYEMDLRLSDFDIRVYDQSNGNLLGTYRSSLIAPAPERLLWFQPAYVEINDLSTVASASRIRIEVQPRTAGSSFWAFVSVTNNDTQQITLVTPQ
jgi:hypothetical protein